MLRSRVCCAQFVRKASVCTVASSCSFMSRIPTRSNPSPPLNVIGVARFPRTMESDDMSTVRLETAAAITLFLASHVCGA